MAQISETELAAIVDGAGYGEAGSIAIAVVLPDGGVVRAARGVITPSTRVYGASLTKQVVAVLVAQEAAAGRIDVDGPIAAWFPDLPGWARDVTVRHLVHHLGGLPDEGTLRPRMPDPDRPIRTGEDMIAAVRAFATLPARPGVAFSYSNIGYVLLGRVLEASTGQPLPGLFTDRVFGPLGMEDSLLWDGPGLYPEGANPLDPAFPTPHSLGDGGMWTTANDLTRWIVAMNEDRFGVRATTTVPGVLNDGTPIEYAWGVIASELGGVRIYAHGGGWNGSISRMAWIPGRSSGFIAFTVDGGDPLVAVSEQVTARLAAD